MAAVNSSSAESASQAREGVTLAALPKSWHFTSALPADPLFPTPADSHKAPRDQLGPRQVRGALFTWVRPEIQKDPELLAVSPAAMRDLGLALSEAETEEFKETVVGNKIHGWDADTLSGPGYPWAQCYGGFQFGDWAGQLGDGRAISLFEATNPRTGVRYEVQLKGAGITPYSRFADGKAVLRSSIREFIVSEALHALGIPSTRALAISLLPHSKVVRERIEPGAIVVRLAQTWLRFGNFDILRARGDRALVRRLATYVAEDVFGGWETLPGRLKDPENPSETPDPERGIPKDEVQGPAGAEENRFARLYREIVRRNALTVAKWQAYGFMNGVLNTDNTSVFGLSMDFGPFAFMDNFDPQYTPNHDDHFLRYSYRNQPTIIWWNLVRLGEALGELIGSGADCDSSTFVESGVTEETAPPLIARAEKLITQAGDEYKSVFLAEFKRLLTLRLGLKTQQPTDFDELFSPLLDTLEALELDFHHFFRRLSALPLSALATPESRLAHAARFFHDEDPTKTKQRPPPRPDSESGRQRLADWLAVYHSRALSDWASKPSSASPPQPPPSQSPAERTAAMKRVNPNFVPRGWVLDEVIRRVEKGGEREVLRRALHLALHPFEDRWAGREFDGVPYEGDAEEEARWTGDVPPAERALQCSCSS
ncbi:34469ab8-6f45-4ece-a7e4-2721ee112cbc [Thermothielavioides terrestris]|uniref:Selenoprotein O n=1 Tax=Thermothielavioides terrestris TaxID=2587410 RepID=A0A446BYD0_9PEZI|nr:34469ab8-6f45-4ece-a7e4-2721ee112cbc [Thermothielavioides terrestris]